MIVRYALLIAFFAMMTSTVSAQETPTKISDFRYGTTGQDALLDVDVVDGKLYGIFSTLFGDQSNGLISEIDPASGATTPVLGPDITSWLGGEIAAAGPTVFSADGKQFVIARDEASSRTLYALNDGVPTLLLSGANRRFSNFVSFKDSLYFLTGNLPISQTPNQQDQILAELWRTDGTPEGTEQVSTLLSFFDPLAVQLVAGEESILMEIRDRNTLIYYIYNGTSGELGLLGEGFSQFILNRPSNADPTSRTIAYHEGGFYLTGIEEGEEFNQLFRVNEETFVIDRIALPNPFLISFGVDAPLDGINFIKTANELLFAGVNLGFGARNGPDLYRINEADGNSFTTLYEPSDFANVASPSIFPAAVFQDTVYQLIRGGNNGTAVFRYAAGMEGAELFTILDPLNTARDFEAVTLRVNETHIFVIDPNDNRILRIAKSSPDTFQDVTVGGLPVRFTAQDPQLEILGDNAFFVNASSDSLEGSGLYRWNKAEDQPTLVTAYDINPQIPQLRGYDTLNQRLLVDADSLFLFDPLDQSRTGVVNDQLPGFDFFHLNVLSSRFVFQGRNSENFEQGPLLMDVDGQLILPTLVTDLPITNDTNYRVDFSVFLTVDTAILRISTTTDEVTSYFPATAYIGGDTVYLNRIEGFNLNNRSFNPTVGDGRVSFRVPSLTSDSVSHYAVNASGTFLGGVDLPSEAPVGRAVTESGIYFEVVDEFFQNSFFFAPFGQPEAVQDINLDRAVPAAFNRFNYYVLGEQLLFAVDGDSLGREWYVAGPNGGEATALLDINPGAGSGIFATRATQIGERLFFAANDGVSGNELWTTDGTPEGTFRVEDLNPGAASSNPSDIILNEGTIFFTANGMSGYELYRMSPDDLTPELIIDLHQNGDGHPYGFQADASNFFFLGRGGEGETFELYQIAYELVPTDAAPTRTSAKVFPNPAGNLPVTVVAPEGENLVRMQVFSQQGQLLQETTNTSEQGKVDLSGLPSGTYWLRSWYASGRFSINAVQRVR